MRKQAIFRGLILVMGLLVLASCHILLCFRWALPCFWGTLWHMMSEPLLLFETIFVEDRSIVELLDPDFTWQSDMLRANYEGNSKAGGEVQVQTFHRVSLDDPRRGGVITNAAIMTMTSTPTSIQTATT